jgi:copper chaperone CopZ
MDRMISTFGVDVDCPQCFDSMIAALLAEPTVADVQASISAGCVSVEHEGDERHLAQVIATTGHRVVVAENAEVLQGVAHAVPGRRCDVHR